VTAFVTNVALLLSVEAPKEPVAPTTAKPIAPVPPKDEPTKAATESPKPDAHSAKEAHPDKQPAAAVAPVVAKSDAGVSPAEEKEATATEPSEKNGKRAEKIEPIPAKKPPGLTRRALCSELERSGREIAIERERLVQDRKDLAAEREALEKKAQEIEDARQALRTETAALEKLLESRHRSSGKAEGNGTASKAEPVRKKADVESLAKTVKAMKADQAAILVGKLDRALAADVLRRMKPSDAGGVLEKLKPELAADLMAMMASSNGKGAGK
jgi:flagellar motility protein MotE (MotC chaperone)